MKDDLIEDSGFELGKAHQSIAKLIVMHRDSSTELAALKIEHERLKWTLTKIYDREREREPSRIRYTYGDFNNKIDPAG
ncbi:hypothetical protein [Pseudomonas fluorescens]|uniref:hypothetical protein n=1 Tax=Pseudomonas fluorescens TaxID=294 RepID=UPI00070AD202|nr:hypothetical protein [Pseudomonas fluorescens]